MLNFKYSVGSPISNDGGSLRSDITLDIYPPSACSSCLDSDLTVIRNSKWDPMIIVSLHCYTSDLSMPSSLLIILVCLFSITVYAIIDVDLPFLSVFHRCLPTITLPTSLLFFLVTIPSLFLLFPSMTSMLSL
jgi:hypothetical protein